jgi:hypothetical protein
MKAENESLIKLTNQETKELTAKLDWEVRRLNNLVDEVQSVFESELLSAKEQIEGQTGKIYTHPCSA